MRIEVPREFERLGAVRIYGLQKIYELDAGAEAEMSDQNDAVVRSLPAEALYGVQREMAIVVPVKSERLKLIEGVLVGIPNSCLVIVVSNSPREPVDRFFLEQESIANFCRFTRKQVLIVHQRDPVIGAAFAAAGYPDLLDDTGCVRPGKAEGMMIGTLLARMMGKRTVGFVDSDNYFPGAVNEYIREYAAGVAQGRSAAAGVRTLVVPGSHAVKRQAEAEGLDQVFINAGFDWREPGCSMCLAMNPDKLVAGERCASTSNRNFEGRQGRGGRTHLVSPAVAAATAVAGHFATPTDLDPVR